MKWLPLKIFQSNLIAQEVDLVSEKYISKKGINILKNQISATK